MTTDPAIAYDSLKSRDPRFDGIFYVGVTSTGIYCRPVCPAKTPRLANCRFYDHAEAAEKAGFRPCLRCRLELAPGKAPVDNAHRIAQGIVDRLGEGLSGEGSPLEEIAAQFGVSSRQLRRIVQSELGVSPMELIQTRRLLLAKQLLTETALPVTEIAFASGFSSLRRFNDAFLSHYHMTPSRLRQQTRQGEKEALATSTSVLRLTYRPPYDWDGVLEFLRQRTIREVEFVTADAYLRTVRLGGHTGWVRVTHLPEKQALAVEFTHTLAPALPALLARLRNLFDLTARPDLIQAHLSQAEILRDSVRGNPGLRVPGAFDGFELAVRAVLGQQVTVKAATTLACRFAESFGEPIATPFPELRRLSPLPAKIATAGIDAIARLGIISARATSIVEIAKSFCSGSLTLQPGELPEPVIARLCAIPGIGQWTAHYIAMRALRWPDAFPKEDIAIRNRLGGVTAREAEILSQPWRPWRSYAVLHLWKGGSRPL